MGQVERALYRQMAQPSTVMSRANGEEVRSQRRLRSIAARRGN